MDANKQPLSLTTLALWGALALVLVLVGAVWIEAYYLFLEQREVTVKRVEVEVPEREAYLAEQQELLAGYRWIEREAGVVHLPIERAMELVAQENRRVEP